MKDNGTAASKAHPPEKRDGHSDLPHAHSYPGKKTPKAEVVVHGGSHNAAELKAGRSNSLGVSANGSHKGLASSHEYVGHDGYDTSKQDALGAPRDVSSKVKHDQAELEAGRGNSMGTSADGSHKGLPAEYAHVGEKAGR